MLKYVEVRGGGGCCCVCGFCVSNTFFDAALYARCDMMIVCCNFYLFSIMLYVVCLEKANAIYSFIFLFKYFMINFVSKQNKNSYFRFNTQQFVPICKNYFYSQNLQKKYLCFYLINVIKKEFD